MLFPLNCSSFFLERNDGKPGAAEDEILTHTREDCSKSKDLQFYLHWKPFIKQQVRDVKTLSFCYYCYCCCRPNISDTVSWSIDGSR